MIYILDSSFFIDASRLHLPLDKNPAFWSWLITLAGAATVSIPEMVHKELITGNDNLAAWIKANQKVLVNQTAAFTQISRVMAKGYGAIDEILLEGLKADPWVIAHALAVGGTVVTSERPGNQTAPRKKKIPSVCAELHVPCCTITAFLWQMRSSLPA
ncbi:DUF4411 family protein [Desulfovibrio sp. ZJ369]|uniref:DUF4411 family protein n=1 Tax=Desulfovibrio sp. ZJ369 TaxID=2709793 RepID=UPI0013EC6CE3|nr:DUF4411 family protein [Desulfovibrio sp. ZJ369]